MSELRWRLADEERDGQLALFTVDGLQAQVNKARLALPSTSGLPDFLRTLQSIGNATLAAVSALPSARRPT